MCLLRYIKSYVLAHLVSPYEKSDGATSYLSKLIDRYIPLLVKLKKVELRVLVIIEVDSLVMLPAPVIFPPMVRLAMLDPAVMLVSGVLMFCAFTEFSPTIATIPIIAAMRGTIRTNCVLIVCS